MTIQPPRPLGDAPLMAHDTLGSLVSDAVESSDALDAQAMRAGVLARLFGPAHDPVAIGRYRILRRVGSGGMGVVHEAYDPELQRNIALKVVNGSGIESTVLLREARAIAKLTHPNVVAVHDVGHVVDEMFIAMEFVDGEDLASWNERKAPWKQALQVYRQAGEGLSAAHRAKIVHGDFKPQNALYGNDGRVRVVDFGLARAIGSSLRSDAVTSSDDGPPRRTEDLRSTAPKGGSPLYMAPEQHRLREATEASDQFSFCVALYEALHGRHPFGVTPQDAMEAVYQHRTGFGPMAPESGGRKLPTWLRSALARGMAADPADRWPSMDALLVELNRDPWRTRRRWAGATATVLAIIGGYGMLEYREMQRASACSGLQEELADVWGESRKADVHAALQKSGATYAEQTWHRVEQLLDDYARGWIAERTDVCSRAQLRSDESDASTADTKLRCLVRRRIELGAVSAILATSSQDVVLHAVQAASSLSPVETCNNDRVARVVGRHSDPELDGQLEQLRFELIELEAKRYSGQFEGLVERGEAIVAKAGELGDAPLQAEGELALGHATRDVVGDIAKAIEHLERAVWLGVEARHDSVVAQAASLAMLSHAVVGETAAARYWMPFALAAMRRLGEGGREEAFYRNDVGITLHKLGDYKRAHTELVASLDLKRKLFGERHIDIARSLNNVGTLLEDTGEFNDAIASLKQARLIMSENLGVGHPYVGLAALNTGLVQALMRRDAAADASLRDAMHTFDTALGPDHPWSGAAWMGLCRLELQRKQFAQARDLCVRAERLLSSGFGEDSLHVAEARGLHAAALLGLDEVPAAVEHARRALEQFDKASESTTKGAEARFVLARATSRQPGRNGEAAKLAKLALTTLREAGPGWIPLVDDIQRWLAETTNVAQLQDGGQTGRAE